MAWYPGVAFFLAIVAFNVWGEGLRRFLTKSRINISRLFSKYTAIATGVLVVGLVLILRNTAPLGVYRSQARQFDAQRSLKDIRVLASPEFEGRETGTPGARSAAEYIAGRMDEIGLFPAGEGETYMRAVPSPRFHMTEVPRLEVLDGEGAPVESLIYREDFVEYAGPYYTYGEGEGAVVGLVTGPDPGTSAGDPYGIAQFDLAHRVILVREVELERIAIGTGVGVLVISDDPSVFQRKHLFRGEPWRQPETPVMLIAPAVADRLLATAGSSLAELESMAASLGVGEAAVTGAGATVHLDTPLEIVDTGTGFTTPGEVALSEEYFDVIGFIPGTGSHTGPAAGMGLDSLVVMVSAYYDGVGVGPDGTHYPGANDNCSGVAMMLELARVLKDADYAPKRTVVFVAWSGGERSEGLSVSDVMNAKIGFRMLTVEAVIELSGVGAGAGEAVALDQTSSFRLVQLFQQAADRMGTSTTTRGRGPHYGLPVAESGNRSALTAYVSWDGSDRTAHTPGDTANVIDPEKLEQVGQTTLLVLTVLSREVEY
jgi:hypothetical protein